MWLLAVGTGTASAFGGMALAAAVTRGHANNAGPAPPQPTTQRWWVLAVVGAGTGLLCAGLVLRHPAATGLAAGCLLATIAGPLALTDLTQRRLPDPLVLGGLLAVVLALGGAAAVRHDGSAFLHGVEGGAASFAAYALLALATGGLGGGDVKLAAATGTALGCRGWDALLLASLLSFATAALAVIPMRRRGQGTVPFGPFLLGGALTVLLWD